MSGSRILRLTEHGPAALDALLADEASPGQRRLGRRLVAAGFAHPCPSPRRADATTVIPVRDRPADLARCLCGAGNRVVVVDDGSRDSRTVAAICRRHGATLVRREHAGGPAVARNAGLAAAHTQLVAFLDSDCVPPVGWIDELAGHFDDPLVVAVAPRVRALGRGRSPLDMGTRPAEVGPGHQVAYVPSAALVVRREALPELAFDPALRYGEDVDLVWRLIDAGWRVRYDPTVVVRHREHNRISRRFRYGMSAAPLARRHPGRLAHVVVRPWPAATLALLLARRPLAATLAFGTWTAVLARRLTVAGVPARLAPVWTARTLRNTITQFARLATPYGAGVVSGYLLARARRRAGGRPSPARPPRPPAVRPGTSSAGPRG